MKLIGTTTKIAALHLGVLAPLLLAPPPLAGQAETDDAAECRVFGRVLDALTGAPVAGASVWLESMDDQVFLAGRETSTDGTYAIELSECEPTLLRVNMLGYSDAVQPLTFEGDERMRAVTIRLEPSPVEVEELTVEVERSLRLRDVGFYARKAWVDASGEFLGEFYDPVEIEGRSRTSHTVSALIRNARITFLFGLGGPLCDPSYYIDGRWFRRAESAVNMLSYGIQPKDIEGIEIYRPIHGSVPEEYRDPNSSSCGAIVVWTKLRDTEIPQITVELCEPSDDPNGMSFGGTVSDELSGVVLPASYVTLNMTAYGETKDYETVTDEYGRYRYCDLAAWPNTVQARYGTSTAEPFEIDQTRAQPGYFEIDLKLSVVRTGSVVGVVAREGVAVPGAEVTVDGTDMSATPDAQGYFEIHGVMPGDHEVVVRRGGDELLRRSVSVRSGATEALTLEVDSN